MVNVEIRAAYPDEWDEAMDLAYAVFLDYEADEYGPEGTEAFGKFITDSNLKKLFLNGRYQVYVAGTEDKIVGVLSVRNGNHISLLFVDGQYHRNGIGMRLVEYAVSYIRRHTSFTHITVNSSPYAKEFYHSIGFRDTSGEKREDGIIFTPMERKIQ